MKSSSKRWQVWKSCTPEDESGGANVFAYGSTSFAATVSEADVAALAESVTPHSSRDATAPIRIPEPSKAIAPTLVINELGIRLRATSL